MHWQICLVARTSHPHHRHPPKGWVLRAGPPALSGVFLPLFFLRRRRKNGAPGGRQPYCMENIKTQKPASQKKSPKLQPQCVSNSEAASGLLTRPDDGCSHKSAWHPVQCAAVVPMRYTGGEIQGRGLPPPLAASFFPDSFFAGEERIGPPEGANRFVWQTLAC